MYLGSTFCTTRLIQELDPACRWITKQIREFCYYYTRRTEFVGLSEGATGFQWVTGNSSSSFPRTVLQRHHTRYKREPVSSMAKWADQEELIHQHGLVKNRMFASCAQNVLQKLLRSQSLGRSFSKPALSSKSSLQDEIIWFGVTLKQYCNLQISQAHWFECLPCGGAWRLVLLLLQLLFNGRAWKAAPQFKSNGRRAKLPSWASPTPCGCAKLPCASQLLLLFPICSNVCPNNTKSTFKN